MAQLKHTPGPWLFKQDSRDIFHSLTGKPIKEIHNWIRTSDKSDNAIAATIDNAHTVEANEANARLIAAAPEMLEALENIENDNGSIPAAIWDLRNKAIAKARGE